MKKIKYIIEFLAVTLLLPVLILIPYRIRIKIGGFLGLAVYYIYKRRREIALINISKSFPDESVEWHNSICKDSFRHFGIATTEFIQLIRFNDKFIEKYISVEGEEYIKQTLSEGKGMISICPHLGNWEFVAAYVAYKGYPLSVIMKRQSNPYINIIIERLRLSFNMEVIYKSRAGFPALRALKQNRIIALVADQDAGKNGIFVDFFGRPASTAQGPARIALAYQSPVTVSLGIREKNGKIKIVITPELQFDYGKKKEEIVYKNTEIWTKKIEEYIKAYPEQYFWMHRRWKTKM